VTAMYLHKYSEKAIIKMLIILFLIGKNFSASRTPLKLLFK
jgi:hypothetical protein